jgi:hypothetical protein
MRKILTSLALVGAMGSVSYAQENIDLRPFAVMINNQVLNGHKFITNTGIINTDPAPADSIQGAILYGIDSSGGTLTATDSFAFFGPWSVMGTDGTVPFNRGFSLNGNDIVADADGTIIFYLDNSWVSSTDSIQTLLNVQFFEQNGVGFPFEDMLYRRSEFVDGQTYGWYTHMRPYPNWDESTFVDPNQDNNWAYTPVIWQSGTSVKDLLANQHYSALNVYPNPAIDNINFKLDFTKANKSTVVRVLDLSGRSVSSKFMGSSDSGTKEFSYNIATLPAGSYTLQVITDNTISVAKFVKN